MAYKVVDVEKIKKAIEKKQKTIDKNSRKLKTAPKYITVGWDGSSGKYPEQDGKEVQYIAMIHNDGLGPHSEKKMIETTQFLHEEKWQQFINDSVQDAMSDGKIPDYYKIFEELGEIVKKDLQDYVREIDLVDTERLVNSVIVKYRRR